MRKFIILFVFVIAAVKLFAAEHVAVFHAKVPGIVTENMIKFGVKSGASPYIDSDLGEKELPNMKPIGGSWGIYLRMEAEDSVGNGGKYIWSRQDFRAYAGDRFSTEHTLLTFFESIDSLILTPLSIPAEIDSIIMEYRSQDLVLYRENIRDLDSLVLSNHYREVYHLTVYYNISSFVEESGSEVRLYPLPAGNYLNIDTDRQFRRCSIYDINGRRIVTSDFDGKGINISGLHAGAYYLRLDDEVKVYKFVKR